MGRLACAVPFCRRTVAVEPGWREWLCSRHWRLVDRRLRRMLIAAQRLRRRGRPRASVELWLWRECKRQACDRGLAMTPPRQQAASRRRRQRPHTT